jgi:hypothetical protein
MLAANKSTKERSSELARLSLKKTTVDEIATILANQAYPA